MRFVLQALGRVTEFLVVLVNRSWTENDAIDELGCRT